MINTQEPVMINQGRSNRKPHYNAPDTGQLESDHIGNESSTKKEDTVVFYGVDAVIDLVIWFLNQTHKLVYACVDQTRPILSLDIPVLRKAFEDAKRRGVKLVYVTEITKENLSYCKQLMETTHELRHLEGIKGNFYISEIGYLAPAAYHEKGMPASQIIYSNVNEIIEHQKYVFESFWHRAIPAEQRINEIEAGIDSGKTEIIYNPQSIYDLFLNMVKFAKHEILLIIPTINAFLREERIGMLKLLKQVCIEHEIIVRILTPTNTIVEDIIHKTDLDETLTTITREQEKEQKKGVAIYRMNSSYEEITVNTVTILVIDKKESLAIEKKNDLEQDFIQAIGLATYSTSGPTVMSYVSIFEGLWKQTELYERLKLHDKMQKEFINIAAHELRTPVQPILGLSDVLKSKIKDNEQLVLVDVISRNAKRLQRLTEDILDVSKIESQSLKLKNETFNLNEVVRNVTAEYSEYGGRALGKPEVKITSTSNDDGGNVIVSGDRGRLYQVISNFVRNAIRFTHQGNIDISIDIAQKNNKEVVLSVRDTGSGIDPEIIPRLFTKFASRSGTGVELYISKNIVEAHGGRIWAQNNPHGMGATFSFSLPVPAQRPI
ncbi:MAG TPA: ATP-binding protein [Nitrososphaeraceae archaeon]|nr:ATP-binding protein [Nitrososphaeraceae archaeon]